MYLLQEVYTKQILQKYKMEESNLVETFMELSLKLSNIEGIERKKEILKFGWEVDI